MNSESGPAWPDRAERTTDAREWPNPCHRCNAPDRIVFRRQPPRQVVSRAYSLPGKAQVGRRAGRRQTITVPAEILENDNACDRCRHSGLRRVPPVESRRRERASALQSLRREAASSAAEQHCPYLGVADLGDDSLRSRQPVTDHDRQHARQGLPGDHHGRGRDPDPGRHVSHRPGGVRRQYRRPHLRWSASPCCSIRCSGTSRCRPASES